MFKSQVTEKQTRSIVRSPEWITQYDEHISLYLVPLYQDRVCRISSELGSQPWSLCTLESDAFFLVPNVEDDGDQHFVQTGFYQTLLSAEGLGISATLYASAILSGMEDYGLAGAYACLYHLLRQYSENHEEARQILAAAV